MRSIRLVLAVGATLTILAALACGGASTSGTAPAAAYTYASAAAGTYANLYGGHAITFTDGSSGKPTSWAWTFGDGSTSTEQNPVHIFTVAAVDAPDSTQTFTVKLTASNSAGSTTSSQDLVVHQPQYNIYQDISTQAQSTTASFSGFAMMTGNLNAQTFFPPGKVADYTGFQYLRDNDPSNMGHNTDFVTKAACNVISILTDAQLAQMVSLATAQQASFDLYGYKRYTLMKAFRRLMDRDLPAGTTGLSLDAVKACSRDLYLIDGQISYDRAVLYADLLNQMATTANPNKPAQTQQAYLDAMKGFGCAAWPDVTMDTAAVQARMKSLSQDQAVLVMTYAGDIFSWYAGSVDADVYFCPERHGTYYGGFFMKDAPAIGHDGYAISETLTAEAGSVLLGLSGTGGSAVGQAPYCITQPQADAMTALWGATEQANLAGIVAARTQIATLLRGLRIKPDTDGSVLAQVLAQSGTYGEYDGANNYYLATGFADIYNKMLDSAQKTALLGLRSSILTGTYAGGTPFDFTNCTTWYLYSAELAESVVDGYMNAAVTDPLFQ